MLSNPYIKIFSVLSTTILLAGIVYLGWVFSKNFGILVIFILISFFIYALIILGYLIISISRSAFMVQYWNEVRLS